MPRFLLALAAGVCLLAPAAVWPADSAPDVKTIVHALDQMYRSSDSYAEVEMQVVNPNFKRTLTMAIWSQGMKKTFIRILAPVKDRGVATLRDGTEMWNYFPKIDKVMKVPPSMMMGSWMGSDFTNDDLVRETSLLDDYEAKLIAPADADPSCYYIELIPKTSAPSVWGKIIAVVDKKDYLPIHDEYYDEKGAKQRLVEFKDVKEFSGKRIPARMELTPLNKPGNQTVILYRKATFNQGVPTDTFTLRNLQKKI